ncbi:MAG: hypothetical protein HY332_18625 [Chloroflexi bacterium]|nr:hypothetical protein [Chloroflexota bacterium]
MSACKRVDRRPSTRRVVLEAGPWLAGGVAAACAPRAEPTRPDAQPASLWIMTRGSESIQQLNEQFVQQFMAARPGVRVQRDELGGPFAEQVEKVKTLAVAGTAPDAIIHLDHGQAVLLAAWRSTTPTGMARPARGSLPMAARSSTTWRRRSSACWSGAKRSTCSNC